MKFIVLINVKMPTIDGILTFVSMINKTSTRAWMGIFKSRLANKIYLDKMYISKPTR